MIYMSTAVTEPLVKTVRVIQPTKIIEEDKSYRQLRTAAYCRVSTDSDEQELSFEAQVSAYTDKIMRNPDWTLVDIFADEGISGTQAYKRKDFMRMMRMCRQGKIDQIITKSVSRFARNTVDCLEYIRELRSLGIPVIFEKEGLNTLHMSSEIYISMHSIFAQSESESLSGNVKWGKQKSAEKGNVTICYKSFLGFRKGADGKPEIVPEEAEVINFIGDCFLDGDSINTIKIKLESKGIPSPTGKEKWSTSTIKSILTNEKYKGDALLCKTYVVDCISKKTVKNTDRPQYYVSNCLPRIMSSEKFDRIQMEIARRGSLGKKRNKNTTTELGKYSSKYALSEILVCGKCGTPYRRCVWKKNGKTRYVWRCINRMDYGKKYCPDAPTIDEYLIHDAIVKALNEVANDDSNQLALKNLQVHIREFYNSVNGSDIIQDELHLNTLIDKIMQMAKTMDANSEEFIQVSKEINDTKEKIAKKQQQKKESYATEERMNEVLDALEKLKDTTIAYDDAITRKLIDRIIVVNSSRLKICFKNGPEKTIIIGE